MNDGELIELPEHTALIKRLKRDGLFDYGQVVEWPIVCEVFGIQLEARQTWAFNGPWLKFCGVVSLEHGLRVTEAGMNGKGFRFLLREEMADAVDDDIRRAANRLLKDSLMISQVPRDGLDDLEQKKLDHAEVKSAYIGATIKHMRTLKKLPAAAEMAHKQLLNISDEPEAPEPPEPPAVS